MEKIRLDTKKGEKENLFNKKKSSNETKEKQKQKKYKKRKN